MPVQHLPAARLLARDGVLRRDALRAAGLSPVLGDRLAQAGQAVRLAPSTWLLTTDRPTDGQLVAAALAHAGPDAVVTGAGACRLLGLPDAPAAASVEVLVDARVRRVSTPYVRVQPTTRPPDCWSVRGVLLAEPHRAVVDAAVRMTDPRAVRALVLGAVGSRWCSTALLAGELGARARNGTALCRRALRDAAEGARSAPEAEAADLVRAASDSGRLPAALLNPTLLLDGRVLGSPDGWLPGLGLGWEVDTRRHHSEDDDFDATLERHDRFASAGLQLLHVTPRRLRGSPTGWLELLVAAASRRRTAAVPEPADLLVRPHDADVRPLRTRPGRPAPWVQASRAA